MKEEGTKCTQQIDVEIEYQYCFGFTHANAASDQIPLRYSGQMSKAKFIVIVYLWTAVFDYNSINLQFILHVNTRIYIQVDIISCSLCITSIWIHFIISFHANMEWLPGNSPVQRYKILYIETEWDSFTIELTKSERGRHSANDEHNAKSN